MVNILMNGCNGKMGQVITELVEQDDGVCISAGVDVYDGIENSYPVFKSIEEVSVGFDVIIDFSTAAVVGKVIDYCEKHRKPAVICTTGLSDEILGRIDGLSKTCAVLRSANMSIGVNVLMKLLKQAVVRLAPEGFDIEIVEKHHNQKLDAPSGTALSLADAMNEEMGGTYEYVYDRSGVRKKRDKKEMGISAVRGGNIVGDHDVIFAGTDEVITISHSAYSKKIFAKGAIAGAKYLCGKAPGMYDMSDVME